MTMLLWSIALFIPIGFLVLIVKEVLEEAWCRLRLWWTVRCLCKELDKITNMLNDMACGTDDILKMLKEKRDENKTT